MFRKSLLTVMAALLGVGFAQAQIRTGADAAGGNFVIGLDNYLKVSTASAGAAAFDFSTQGKAFKLILREGALSVLESGKGEPDTLLVLTGTDATELVAGIHDFTADRQPELLLALRGERSLRLLVLDFRGGAWETIGEIAASGDGVCECRIFRQVVTIDSADGLYTWTWRGGAFRFRSSAGSDDPASALQ
jgi:hypothetical protein